MKKIVILLSLIFLSGCGNEVLECNDSDAKDEVMNIIRSQVKKSHLPFVPVANISDETVSNIKTKNHDEGIKENVCSAEYSFTYDGKVYTTNFLYKLTFLEDKKTTEISVETKKITNLLEDIEGDLYRKSLQH